jgi:hypothetical protein
LVLWIKFSKYLMSMWKEFVFLVAGCRGDIFITLISCESLARPHFLYLLTSRQTLVLFHFLTVKNHSAMSIHI